MFLPSLRARPALLGALAVDAIGNGLAGPLLLLYFTRAAGLHLATVGAVISLANLIAFGMPAVVGLVIAKVGPLAVVVTAQALQALAFFGYLFVRTPWQLGIAAVVGTIGMRAFWSGIFSLVTDPAADPGEVFAEVGATQSAGLGIGALIAGALLTAPGTAPLTIVVALDAGSFAVSGALLLLRHRRSTPVPELGTQPLRTVLGDRRFLGLVAANSLFAGCSMLFGVGLPVLLYNHTDAPHWLIGALLAAVTLLVALGQPWGVRRSARLTRSTVLALAGGLWCLWGIGSAAAAAWSGPEAVALVCAAAVPFALAELLHAPASITLASTSAPAEHRSAYLALFQYSWAIANIAVPFSFTALDAQSPTLPWLAIAIAAAVATLIIVGLRRPAAAVVG
jgi:MFS family permease